MSGDIQIMEERRRQILDEGFDAAHDDAHTEGELMQAAKFYIMAARAQVIDPNINLEVVPADWPWHNSWWKPSDDPKRNLVKAGALIAAEIDRLQRRG